MKTRRFDYNYKPLQLNLSFVTEGSVPRRQTYDAAENTYLPDYTLTPLIIQPRVGCLDKDGVIAPGPVNASLANVKWFEVSGGAETPIQSSNTGYAVTTSGDNAGRIKVKHNVQVGSPLTLKFHAEYVDSRTGQIHTIERTVCVRCDNATLPAPEVELDAAPQTIYNPLRDTADQTVHAVLRQGNDVCPAPRRQFVWELCREDGSWSAVGANAVMDYDVEVSADGASCTVHRDLMGEGLTLRCRARYDVGGNPAGVALNDASPCSTVSFVRRIPKYEYDIAGIPENIPADLAEMAPEAAIWDTKGPITDPERVLSVNWYIATNKASGSLSYSEVATGMRPLIPTTALSKQYGAVLALDVKDAGPLCAMEDSDGALLEDGNGDLLVYV